MTAKDKIKQIGFLTSALEAEHGYELQFATAEDMKKYRQQLYNVRKTLGKEYEALSFVDRGTALWITRN